MGTVSQRVHDLLISHAAVVVVIEGLYVATPHREGIRVTADAGGYGEVSGDVVVRLRRLGHGYAVEDYSVRTPGLTATLLDAEDLGWEATDAEHDALLSELEAEFGDSL